MTSDLLFLTTTSWNTTTRRRLLFSCTKFHDCLRNMFWRLLIFSPQRSSPLFAILVASYEQPSTVTAATEDTAPSGPLCRRVCFIGKPCSGKGTQAPLLSAKYGMAHLSTGQILRDEVEKRTPLGLFAKERMACGELLPDNVVLQLVSNRIAQEDCQRFGYILDGFPRNASQGLSMQDYDIMVDLVFLLNRSDEDAIEWMRERLYDPSTGIIYHSRYFPPPSKRLPFLQRRMDDNEETMRKRLVHFRSSCPSILQVFKGRVIAIDTSNHRPTQQIFQEICYWLENFPVLSQLRHPSYSNIV